MKRKFLAILLLLPILVYCGGKTNPEQEQENPENQEQTDPEPEPEPQPPTPDPQITYNGESIINIGYEGGTITIAFIANRNWTITTPEWLVANPASGSASESEASVSFTCEPNLTSDPKNASVVITAETAKVSISMRQAGYPYADAAPEVKNGETILVTNPNVEKFVTEVTYPDKDYSFTKIYDYYGGANGVKYDENGNPDENGEAITNPSSDKPNEFSIRWTANAAAGDMTFHLEEPNWMRDVTVNAGECYVNFTNLVPNTTYSYKVTGSNGAVLAEGTFNTTGHIRQLFFRGNVRNCRDLGGWKTEDGKTVKYRKIYRGGRLEGSTMNTRGKKDILAEGIGAQLDLRGKSDVLKSPAIESFAFCAPVIESGGTSMLDKDKAKTKECFEFVVNSLRENKPVYFHCSLGRDRTGTMAMLLLGLLGVRDGDVSKEYEVTYFAPRGWSIAYSETYTTFQNNRTKWIYSDAAPFFWNFAGEDGSFADGIQNYLLSIGVSQTDIDDYRSMMLE